MVIVVILNDVWVGLVVMCCLLSVIICGLLRFVFAILCSIRIINLNYES